MADDVEVTLVTMRFTASDPAGLLGVLSRYVVVSRGHDGCRNIDLCQSVVEPSRFVVVQKWASPEAQRAHFDSEEMVGMARACEGLVAERPEIDLLQGLSAHDLA